MENFSKYLENAFELNFVQGQYNNKVRDLYVILRAGVRLVADTLVISPANLVLAKFGGQLDIGSGSMVAKKPWLSFRKAMRIILKHDKRVGQNMELVTETSKETIYRFVIPIEEQC